MTGNMIDLASISLQNAATLENRSTNMIENIYPLRVYFDDTDCTGIVYHANYLKFFERARSEWAEQIGLGTDWQRDQKMYFTIRNVKLDYLKPATLHQKIEVVTRISSLRPASLIYDQHLRLAETTDTILCKAEIKVACIDFNLRPRALPPGLTQILGEFV